MAKRAAPVLRFNEAVAGLAAGEDDAPEAARWAAPVTGPVPVAKVVTAPSPTEEAGSGGGLMWTKHPRAVLAAALALLAVVAVVVGGSVGGTAAAAAASSAATGAKTSPPALAANETASHHAPPPSKSPTPQPSSRPSSSPSFSNPTAAPSLAPTPAPTYPVCKSSNSGCYGIFSSDCLSYCESGMYGSGYACYTGGSGGGATTWNPGVTQTGTASDPLYFCCQCPPITNLPSCASAASSCSYDGETCATACGTGNSGSFCYVYGGIGLETRQFDPCCVC